MTQRTVSATTTIDAPPEVVFGIVANPHQHARIDGSGSVQSVVEGPDRLAAGAQFDVSMRMFGVPYTISNRVVEFEPDRRIAWRHFGGHRWRYELEPAEGERTRVTETFDYSRYNRAWRTVITVAGFPGRNRRGIEATLVRLKQAAEADRKASR